MPMVLAGLVTAIAVPLLLMIATCLLQRVESGLVPRAERVVRSTSIPAAQDAPPRHLTLVRGDGEDGAPDADFDPDATAQLRRIS